MDLQTLSFTIAGISVLVFVACAFKRQWSIAALLVGLVQLMIGMGYHQDVVRGVLEPTRGFNLGLIHADNGIEVAIFGLAFLVGALASACIAVLNRPGERNYIIVAFNSFLLLVGLPSSISDAMQGRMRGVQFGDTLEFSGLLGLLFTAILVLGPLILSIRWAWRRARASV